MRKINLRLIVFILSLTSCKAQNSYQSAGLVLHKTRTFDTISNSFVLPKYFKDFKIWYKDSVLIQEANHLSIRTDPYNNETWEFILDKYIFIDLKNKSFYEYGSFSDTATLIKSYFQDDSVHVEGGWNFYAYNQLVPNYNPEALPDTTIDGVAFKRFKRSRKFSTEEGEKESIFIGYLRCDKKGTIFQFDKAFSEKIGCPLIKYEAKIIPDMTWLKAEFEYVNENLTPTEQKIFAAWEKYAKKNPVKK